MGRGTRKGRGGGGPSVAKALLPSEEENYYAELESKHFSANAVGSRFKDTTLVELLDANPHLLHEGNDHEELLRLGVPKEALLPDRSYFLLRCQGQEGMIAADKLHPETPVSVKRAKGESLSFTTRGERQETHIATAIVGQYPRDPSRRALLTVFPGLPAEPERSSIPEENSLGIYDGQTLSLRELQEKLGRDDLLLQVEDPAKG